MTRVILADTAQRLGKTAALEMLGAVALVEAELELRGLDALVEQLDEQILDAQVKGRGTSIWFAQMRNKLAAARSAANEARRQRQDQLTAWEKTYRPERWR